MEKAQVCFQAEARVGQASVGPEHQIAIGEESRLIELALCLWEDGHAAQPELGQGPGSELYSPQSAVLQPVCDSDRGAVGIELQYYALLDPGWPFDGSGQLHAIGDQFGDAAIVVRDVGARHVLGRVP